MGGAFSIYPEADPLDAKKMCGAWYVVESNLDVWNPKSSRICPVVLYQWMEPSEEEKKKCESSGKPLPVRVRDVTEFRTGTLEEQSAECSYYLGIDTQHPTNPSQWRWRGTGKLFALSSDWQMVLHDVDYAEWAVTIFSATAFTKAGFDIYSRTPTLSAERLEQIHRRIEQTPFLKERAQGLFNTIQDPRGRDRPGKKEG